MTEIHNQYSMMKFPDYEFQEYPKYICKSKHGDVIANDAQHEAELRKIHFPEPEKAKEVEKEKSFEDKKFTKFSA